MNIHKKNRQKQKMKTLSEKHEKKRVIWHYSPPNRNGSCLDHER
ncbi:hypothetical protein B4168_3764 [Anoxybacillus flavithermus]|nr:hypothetical protein B4168_3764 [Anoxybacillus flavithermus]OAO88052.1 hypothetical protein GT23_0785 [Parageobacillus thermoglucosidasius]